MKITHEQPLDLKALIKTNYTIEEFAKKLHMSRYNLSRLMRKPENLTIKRLNEIVSLLGYELEISITY